jgi:signal transduction histidine kinase/ligand-binding sensor domain-containing protein/DNA-binding response OmpR family regulator
MWFGTRDGLNRYDGNGFTVFRHRFKDSSSLICDFVLALYEDSAHKLWIGTRQGLNIYDNLTGRFSVVSYLSGEDHLVRPLTGLIKVLSMDESGNMLIGVEGLGLMIRPKGAATAIQLPLVNGAPASFHYGVQAIKRGADHRIWVQVQNKGLCLLDEAAGHLKLKNDQLPLANCLEYAGKVLWIGNDKGLYRYDPDSAVCSKVSDLPSDGPIPDEIRSMVKDKGHLLLGTMQGRFFTWDIARSQWMPGPGADASYALHCGMIYSLYVDESANQWLGTGKGGIGVIDPQRSQFHTFSNLPGRDGRPATFITSFYETPDSNLWIGTEGEGILCYNRKTEQYSHYRNNPSDRNSLSTDIVIDMCGDHLGNIWVAVQNSGIDRYDPVTRGFAHYRCGRPVAGVEKNMVWAVYEDKRKNLWASTLRQGSLMGALYRFDRAGDRFVPFDTSLSDLFTFYEDREGTLWGGNLSQLVEIDRVGRHHRFYTINAAVRAVWEDKNDRLWVGTEGGGLFLFDRRLHKITARYTTDEGLCNNSVMNILEDRSGDLWLSTANGLSRFTPATGQFRNYFQANGLQNNEFFFNAALKLRSGELAFGGVKGFNLFDPLAIREAGHMPRLLLTGIHINGIPVEKDPSFVARWGPDQAEEIQVPFSKSSFSFDFTALEYSAPKEISYSYFMEGWDRKWTEAGRQRKADYTHLDEGHYIFRVKSTNTEGKWNPAEITLEIIVFPPWYRTWWAYTLYVLLAGSLFYMYWVYKAGRAKLKYEITIARLNAEKERSEHEKKLSFFTNISHEFRTPLTLIINPVKDMLKRSSDAKGQSDARGQSDAKDPAAHPDDGIEQMNMIHRNARRMLSLVDQLLLFRKAESGVDRLLPVKLNLYHLCREVYFSFTQLARAKNIRYEFACDQEDLEVYADREKVEIILFNLVSNALKYTPDGGFVIMRIREGDDRIAVEVADSGPGIPKGTGDRIFERFFQAGDSVPAKPGFGIGLFLARQFAQAHKGDLSYRSEPGDGAIFTLGLLKGAAHFEGANLGEDGSRPSEIFKELIGEADGEKGGGPSSAGGPAGVEVLQGWVDEKASVLVIDDDPSMRQYITSIFRDTHTIYEAADGEEGIRQALGCYPDIIISDIKMRGVSGIDLCRTLKGDPAVSHIPIILVTGTPATGLELEGVEGGADDYITKPFDKELLRARVANLLQSRRNLRQSLFKEVTHSETPRKIAASDKAFLDKCTGIIESHLDEEEFTIKTLAMEMGISHSSLYKKIKLLSGHSLNGFIRLVRLKNAAILCINSEYNVNEIAARVGILDRTHFREQFQKVYGMTAAEYIRRFRKPFTSEYALRKFK